ncbi:DUF5325 family protein [Marinicrinis sediminis]|uniref:DUF5325 family protein n=1 Tax=Marinicrinis sediminis TaxID=1652465 RepID=A0ABW5R758_9BACL
MNKKLSLLFAFGSVLLLCAAGAALSYRQAWLALLFIVLYIGFVGFGFVLKSKRNKQKQGEEH